MGLPRLKPLEMTCSDSVTFAMASSDYLAFFGAASVCFVLWTISWNSAFQSGGTTWKCRLMPTSDELRLLMSSGNPRFQAIMLRIDPAAA